MPLLPGHPTYEAVAQFPGIHRAGVDGKWRMVRLAPWKLVHIPGRPEGEDLLFHLERDPGETLDVADSHPQVLAELREHLRVYLEEDEANPRAAPGQLEPEEIERLRALGYAH